MKYYKLSKTNPGWDSLHRDLKAASALYDPLIIAADYAYTLSLERWEELSNAEVIVYVIGRKLPVFKCKGGVWAEL